MLTRRRFLQAASAFGAFVALARDLPMPSRRLLAATGGAGGYTPEEDVAIWISVATYGAQGDGRTITDAAISSGSHTLTSATAGFTSSDVGKVIVILGAGSAGAALFTTISGYSNSTTVTLTAAAGATVTGKEATYGTDDTVAIQGAVTACPNAGMVLLPLGQFCITSPITIDHPITFFGQGLSELYGSVNVEWNAVNMPMVAPYLAGSVLVVCAQTTNGMNLTGAGSAVHLRTFGIRFADKYRSTGHGIFTRGPVLGSGYDSGLYGGRWEGLSVYGTSGDFYGYHFTNPMMNTFDHLHAFGGGGLYVVNNSGASSPGPFKYGNSVFIGFYSQTFVGGSAHGIHLDCVTDELNLLSFIRPQATVATGAPHVGEPSAPTSAQYLFKAHANVQGLDIVAPDFETNVGSTCTFLTDTAGPVGQFISTGGRIDAPATYDMMIPPNGNTVDTNQRRVFTSNLTTWATGTEPSGYQVGERYASGGRFSGAFFDGTEVFGNKGAVEIASATKLWSGSGVPSNGVGADGDFYLRTGTPGTSNQRIYVKSSGAWVGVV